jgi:hypothetical protein
VHALEQEVNDLVAEKEVGEQLKVETHHYGRRTEGSQPRAKRCDIYGEAGHNAQTCQVAIETSEEENSE